jgi:hypothetical protein
VIRCALISQDGWGGMERSEIGQNRKLVLRIGVPETGRSAAQDNRITALDMRQSSAMRRALPNARDSFSRDQFQSNVPETRGISRVEGVWSDAAAKIGWTTKDLPRFVAVLNKRDRSRMAAQSAESVN